jgi:hypothetical protein
MVRYEDTSVTEVKYANVIDSHLIFDFEQENFKIAFGLTHSDQLTSLINEDYLEVQIQVKTVKNGKTSYT